MAPSVKPIFIHSMPRSGSTLLQRILGSHAAIATASEPHLLLPLIGTYADIRVYDGAVSHAGIQDAIAEFARQLPNGMDDYRDAMRAFVLDLYARASGDKPYFLDKTPPYSVAALQILELFPDAKHVLLWRNPIAILTSLSHTFEANAWFMKPYESQLYHGMAQLLELSAAPQVYSLRYEDLIERPDDTLAALFEYLELDYASDLLQAFPQLQVGGDPTGTKAYDGLSRAPLDKWERELCNPYRTAWTRRYLRWLGEERLKRMGYSLDTLLGEVARAHVRPQTLAYDALMGLYRRLQFLVWPHLDLEKRARIKRLFARAEVPPRSGGRL